MTEHFLDSVRSKYAGSVPALNRVLSTVRDRAGGLADGLLSGDRAGEIAADVRARAIGLGSSAKDWIEAHDTPSRRTGALSIATAVAIGGLVGGAAGAVDTELELERQSVVTELAADQGGEGGGDPDPEAAGPVPAAEPAADPAAEPAQEPAAEPQGPMPPVDDMVVTSPFGYRSNPLAPGALEFHTGTDFGAGTGTPVKAMLGGTVTEAGWHTTGGGGLRVVVDHGDGLQTTYNHLNSIDVSVGQAVDAGAVVGGIGSTGNSTGPHLHFEVLLHGNYEDPMGWL